MTWHPFESLGNMTHLTLSNLEKYKVVSMYHTKERGNGGIKL